MTQAVGDIVELVGQMAPCGAVAASCSASLPEYFT